jgi:hypothetical protein
LKTGRSAIEEEEDIILFILFNLLDVFFCLWSISFIFLGIFNKQ